MTLSEFKNDLMIMALFMLIGFFLRERVKIFQKLFFPTSLIGGLILLILGNQCLNIVEVPESYSTLPGILIDIILAAMVFGVSIGKERVKGYLEYSFITMTAYGIQMGVGILIGALLKTVWAGLPEGWGVMGVFAFHGGHGTAAAAGTQFETLGIDGALSIGAVLSTFGLIVAMTGGMILVNIGIRKGWGQYVKEPGKQPDYIYRGRLPEEKRSSIGRTVVSSISINHLALQFSWLLLSVFVGKNFFDFLGSYIELFKSMPSVLHGIVGGIIVWFLLVKLKLEYLADIKALKQIAGFMLEIVVFSAMATLNLKLVGTYIVPLLIYTLVLSVVSILVILFMSKHFFKEEWFEKCCMAVGAATGNTSTGLALVRAVDPDTRSEAGDTHGMYSTIMSWKDIFVGLVPMWIAANAVTGICITAGIGLIISAVSAVLAYVFRETK